MRLGPRIVLLAALIGCFATAVQADGTGTDPVMKIQLPDACPALSACLAYTGTSSTATFFFDVDPPPVGQTFSCSVTDTAPNSSAACIPIFPVKVLFGFELIVTGLFNGQTMALSASGGDINGIQVPQGLSCFSGCNAANGTFDLQNVSEPGTFSLLVVGLLFVSVVGLARKRRSEALREARLSASASLA
jgi:hypothetical protein